MVAPAHRAGGPYPAGNGSRLSQSGRDRHPPTGRVGAAAPAKPANEVITGFGAESAGLKVIPAEPPPGRGPSASASEAYRELIELGLARGRNARAIWQDLVDAHGFAAGYQSVRRYVQKLRGATAPEACAVIETAPGEDYGESGVMLRRRRRSAISAGATPEAALRRAT
jgi:hypothetical protein